MSKLDLDFENGRSSEIAREIRARRPEPSPALRARIEQVAERERGGESEAPRSSWIKRPRLALVFALALAAVIAGAVVSGNRHETSPTVMEKRQETTVPAVAGSESSTGTVGEQGFATSTDSVLRGAAPESQDAGSSAAKAAPITTGGRLADMRADLTIRVENRRKLANATAWAMRIVRSLDGYVASATYNAPGQGDTASYLELKVPADRAQDALARISSLGEILAQNISLEDVQRTVSGQTDQIRTMWVRIGEIEKTLREEELTTQARSRLQVELSSTRSQLRTLLLQRAQTRQRGQEATIALTLTTGALPKAPHPAGRIEQAFSDAKDRLSSEIAWVVKGLVVASPVLLLGLGLAGFLRLRRRREESRLLER